MRAGELTEFVHLQRARDGAAPADHIGKFWVSIEQTQSSDAEREYIVRTHWNRQLADLIGVSSLGEFYRFIWPHPPSDPPRAPRELIIRNVSAPLGKRELQISCWEVVNQPESE
jgi:hypothetical protein